MPELTGNAFQSIVGKENQTISLRFLVHREQGREERNAPTVEWSLEYVSFPFTVEVRSRGPDAGANKVTMCLSWRMALVKNINFLCEGDEVTGVDMRAAAHVL